MILNPAEPSQVLHSMHAHHDGECMQDAGMPQCTFIVLSTSETRRSRLFFPVVLLATELLNLSFSSRKACSCSPVHDHKQGLPQHV